MNSKKFFFILILMAVSMVTMAQISVVSVTVETSEGAIIGIDDEMSSTNIMTKEVTSGIHTVVVKYNNEIVKREDIDVPVGEVFNKKFPIAGIVNVTSTPIATVSVDGKDVGQTPANIELLGNHDIKVRYESKKYNPISERITVSPFENIDRSYELMKSKRPWKYSWMILPQVTFPTDDAKDMCFGLMIARAKRVGWYVKGIFNHVSNQYLAISEYEHELNDIWPTGKHKVYYKNACAGFMVNIFSKAYLYGGCGYGWQKICYEGYDGKYYSSKKYNSHNVLLDCGLLVNLGLVAINVGCSHILDNGVFPKATAVNAGIGVKF